MGGPKKNINHIHIKAFQSFLSNIAFAVKGKERSLGSQYQINQFTLFLMGNMFLFANKSM